MPSGTGVSSVGAHAPTARAGAAAEVVARGEAGYPARLGALADAPGQLWILGRAPAAQVRTIAIVGARAASGRGCATARNLGHDLGSAGAAIVSGGAFGIDAAAHQGALLADAATFAVLGCGVDVVYPDRHAALFAQIAAAGGLLSEYAPGTPPRRGQFPARNRIIAALADAVLVVEAAHRSGALITARLGLSMGRLLLAAPGSPGTDRLIASGHALPLRSADDVDDALDGRARPAETVELPPGPVASVVAALRDGAAAPAELSRRTGLALAPVLAALAEAELEGWIWRGENGQYEVARRGG